MGTGYSSLLLSLTANIFPHKLADNNPDSQNNLCKPTQLQHHLNLHKRALMGWVSGEPIITRMQCVSKSGSAAHQIATVKTQRLQEQVQHAGQQNKRGPEWQRESAIRADKICEPSQWGLGCTAKIESTVKSINLPNKKSPLWWALRDKTKQAKRNHLHREKDTARQNKPPKNNFYQAMKAY